MSSSDDRLIRVLIVEDAMDQAMFLRALLSSAEIFEVSWAQDGDRALQMFAEHDFDAVLTDLNLPGMDGFDLTREIKRISKAPVLAITGYTHQSYFESAYRAGVDGLLNKPVDRDELLGKLRDLLPDLHPVATQSVRILAIGALPGDAEAGCGGTLAHFQADGAEVLVFVLSPGSGQEAAAVRAAAESLGTRVLAGPLHPHEAEDEARTRRQLLLEQVVREFDPSWAFIPSLGDDTPGRREAHRLARVATEDVPNVMAYMTGSTTLDFRPTVFRGIASTLPRKVAALECYADALAQRPDLSGRFAQANARYWGRFSGFTEVEPFEVVKGGVPT